MRVFISYTGEDLADHAAIVADAVRRLEWVAVDHRDWGASGRPSVSECKGRVLSCDILVVLVAHRYGWVPSKDQDGDGTTSVTWLEVKTARDSGRQVLPYLIDPDASWPVKLIEGLQDRASLDRLEALKADLRKGISGFFGPDPASLERTLALDLMRAGEKLKSTKSPTTQQPPVDQSDALVPLSLYDPLNPPTLIERIRARLPKRILSIDDGAAGGFIAFEFLAEIERRLQIRYGEAGFVLSDYFNLIGGVGTGTLIATNLALGVSVANAKQMYTSIMHSMFGQRAPIMARLKYKHEPTPLKEALRSIYGPAALDSAKFKTCVMLVATRLDTGLIRKAAGVVTVLWQDAVGYDINREYVVTVDCVGEILRGYLDGVPLFAVADASHARGRVGAYAWKNAGAAGFSDGHSVPICSPCHRCLLQISERNW